MWPASSYQPFVDLMLTKFQLSLNNLQFLCSNLPTDGNELANHTSISLYSVRFPDILVLLYSGCRLLVGWSVTEALGGPYLSMLFPVTSNRRTKAVEEKEQVSANCIFHQQCHYCPAIYNRR